MALVHPNVAESFTTVPEAGRNRDLSWNTSHHNSCRLDTGIPWMAAPAVISPTHSTTPPPTHNPRHPKYQDFTTRLDSYVAWPGQFVPQTPQQLASTGFFYIGSADRVTCFQCGITLRDWMTEHDPMAEHKRYAPNCDFINTARTEQVIENAESFSPELPSQTTCTETLGNAEVERNSIRVLQSEAEDLAKSVSDLHLGESACADSNNEEPMIVGESPTEQFIQEKNDDIAKLSVEINDGLVETVECKKAKRHSSLKNENKRLKEQSKCRMCKSQTPSILFLPCGHLVSCPDCAEKVESCFICDRTILGTVKTYRA